MFDHLLESSHRDDSNKWSNTGFGEEITQVESILSYFLIPIIPRALSEQEYYNCLPV